MTPEERAELDARRARVAELENLAKHQAGLSIVLDNGLLQLSELTLALNRAMVTPFSALRSGNALRPDAMNDVAARLDADLRRR